MATLSIFSFLPFLLFLLLSSPPNLVSSQQWGNPPRSSPLGSPGPAAAPGASSPPNLVSSPPGSLGPATAPGTSSPLDPVPSRECNEADRTTLLKVKEEWGNPPDLSTWLPGTDCCTSWDWITCNPDGRVGEFYVIGFNISGQIPAALGDLLGLDGLAIKMIPGITGSIPPSFAKLTNLSSLDIDGTSISGSIPSFLSRFPKLTNIILANNRLSGPIPPSLSELPSLRYVILSGNGLTGTIPAGLLHGRNPWLDLSNNKLTGGLPQSFGDVDIYELDLSNNRLEFDFTHVRFRHNILHLDLSHNRIYGRVPESLKDQWELIQLNLSYNRLCGKIPTGGAMANFSAGSYLHNKCLCGTPLPPCKKPLGN